jgi:transcriptional regulator with XRE-family HTH domain
MTSRRDRIHNTKQPNRPHFIKEWAEKRGFENQAELAKALKIDPGTVSRWYNRISSPIEDHQIALAELFFPGDDPEDRRESLFRNPDEDWFVQFFAGRHEDELARMKSTLEAAFPKKRA